MPARGPMMNQRPPARVVLNLQKSSDSVEPPRAGARGRLNELFQRREDPYAGADLDRARRLGGALWLVAAFFLALLLPLAAPTKSALGANGWIPAAVIFVACLAGAGRMLARPERVGTGELLAMSYVAVVSVAVLEWLGGGHDSPYHQLYILSVVYTACVHPPRRAAVYLAAFVAATAASFTYEGWDPEALADVAVQDIIILGLALLGLVLMDDVRRQRLDLREEGDEARRLATIDDLTGLGNRRGLMADLGRRIPEATEERPLLLILFDLDGFKAYNDSYGHPAGDSLLIRLAANLRSAMEGRGTTYRMGGDEFCVLASVEMDGPKAIAAAAAAALSEHGEGFTVTASYGSILIPMEATGIAPALRLADQRMYAQKHTGRASAGRQSMDVLLRVLSERNPQLGAHLDDVTELCEAVGRKLELPEEELVSLLRAAALHDVGKAAIPDDILLKPGALTPDEWAFMRRHTLIGERILGAAPSLSIAAKLVRSSHERMDGQGYPDGLAGEEIPLGSRIISVCDAFDAMTSERPYRSAMSAESAVAELRRCAGSHFDPMVVETFCTVLAERDNPPLASVEELIG